MQMAKVKGAEEGLQ